VADVPARGGNPYVLFIGNAKPHKNLRLLAAAMDALPDLELVCVGVTDEDVRAAGASSATAARTTALTGIDDRQLAGLYRDAQCLAFPSTYEGFGLPAREAMSLGTPVAHACEAVAETVGPDCGAGVAAGATPAQFAAAVRAAAALKGTPEFTANAEAQLARHTWDRSAALITAALDRVSGR
jgi:glycosyltransferase involved in cell wall biosynthesis